MNDRLHFLDNLRGVTIFLVVCLHVFLCYMKFSPAWWFVIDPKQSLFFTYCVILIDVPIMPTMFFIAGYFALASLQKHGIGKFWSQKIKRIAIPWVIGVLFLSPPAVYMILLSRGKAPGYMEFWENQFWTPTFFSQSVFWFLGMLLMFFAVLTVVFRFSKTLQSSQRILKQPGIGLFVLFVTATFGWFLFMNQFFPADTWLNDFYIIAFQPLRLLIYALYFSLGIMAWKQRWFEEGGFNPKLAPWVALCLFSAVAYSHFKFLMAVRSSELAIQAGNGIFFNLFAFSTMMSGLALFHLLFNGDGFFWKSFSRSSYGIYLLHSIPVYYGAYFLLGLDASPYNKAALLLATSVLLCWGTTTALQKNRVAARII